MAVSYTAVVDVDGEGRNGGHVRSSDGLLETGLALPKELGGAGTATNPEQLLAAGWAACFLGALRRAATTRKIRLTSTSITAEITLTHGDDGEFSLCAVLNPVLAASTRPPRRSSPRPPAGSARTPRPHATTSRSPSTPASPPEPSPWTAGPLSPARAPPPIRIRTADRRARAEHARHDAHPRAGGEHGPLGVRPVRPRLPATSGTTAWSAKERGSSHVCESRQVLGSDNEMP